MSVFYLFGRGRGFDWGGLGWSSGRGSSRFLLQLFHSGAELGDHILEVVGDLLQLGVFQLELLQSETDEGNCLGLS